MEKNILVINEASKIRLSKEMFVIELKEEEKYIPLSSIKFVLVESQFCSITVVLMMELVERQIPIFFCDKSHQPSAEILPISHSYQKSSLIQLQVKQGSRFKNRIWQKIIRQKILNQSIVASEKYPNVHCKFKELITGTNEGDKRNCEAQSARIYFKTIFQSDFSRRTDCATNDFLNYGYAIIRNTIANRLVVFGLEASIGIWHSSSRNYFNLADDLIEPFRPIVDSFVLKNLNSDESLTPENKRELLEVLNEKCLVDGHWVRITTAIDELICSYIRCLKNSTAKYLVLPTVKRS
jgi:CRISPR-associated protein Cas1